MTREELNKERDQLRKKLKGAELELAQVRAENERLRKITERYSGHDISCDHYDNSEGNYCTCGYADAIAKAREGKG